MRGIEISMSARPKGGGYGLGCMARHAIVMFFILLFSTALWGQKVPNVGCHVETYPVHVVTYWQSTRKLKAVEVVVLKDPSGQQQALFDLTHGGTLISLRFQKKELLFGQSAGADVGIYTVSHHDKKQVRAGQDPFWSAFHPDQGGSSMGIPSTVAGIACNGERSMRVISMMVDAGVDNSFQRKPLVGVWAGRVANTFPPGYSTPFVIETDARWVRNPGGTPRYYLELQQRVVNIRSKPFRDAEWSLEGASPWDFDYPASYPRRCTARTPCQSQNTRAIATGRYQTEARTKGIAIVVPTTQWGTKQAFVRSNAEYVHLLYGPVWAAPRHVFSVVLRHDIEGLKGFHFEWFVCAGSWKQARRFAGTMNDKAK